VVFKKEDFLRLSGIRRIKIMLKKIIIPGFNGLSLFELLVMYVQGIIRGAFTTRASAISFSLFMAFFPFLLFLLNLIPFIPVDGFQEEFMSFLYSFLPPKTSVFFDSMINDIVNKQRVGLLSSTFVLSMLLMANGINAVFSGFNNSYHTKITRGFLQQYGVALGVAVIVALFLFATVYITLYFVYYINVYERFVVGDVLFWLDVGRLALFVLMIYITMATLFYFGSKDNKSLSFFSPGAFLTTFLVVVTTYLFGFYIDNFSKYNELYGSIGALLILMVYIWINSNLVLLGYELNASLKNHKQKTDITK